MTTDKVRAAQVQALRRQADNPREPLAQKVQRNLTQTWEAGNRRPERILVRPKFVLKSSTGPAQSTTLLEGKGLQLKLELLLLFEAQCRYGPGQPARSVPSITREADSKRPSLVDMVLTETNTAPHTDRNAADLRARQLTKALKGLEEHHLVEIPRSKPGRRTMKQFKLLEEGNPSAPVRYVIPNDGLAIPTDFFTNLWIFALSDAEIATYLALCWRRRQYPAVHNAAGVYIWQNDRKHEFGLTRWAWRSVPYLHRYGLIERRVEGRDFSSGKIRDFDKAWEKNEVKPQVIQINDGGTKEPALETIYRVLTNPTPQDSLRQIGWHDPDRDMLPTASEVKFTQPSQPLPPRF